MKAMGPLSRTTQIWPQWCIQFYGDHECSKHSSEEFVSLRLGTHALLAPRCSVRWIPRCLLWCTGPRRSNSCPYLWPYFLLFCPVMQTTSTCHSSDVHAVCSHVLKHFPNCVASGTPTYPLRLSANIPSFLIEVYLINYPLLMIPSFAPLSTSLRETKLGMFCLSLPYPQSIYHIIIVYVPYFNSFIHPACIICQPQS